MGLSVKAGFGSGELDPALWERTDFEKYKAGLATARNVVIGKSGRIVSRPGRVFYKKTKLDNSKCRIYGLPYRPFFLEWGHEYVRVHHTDDMTYDEFSHALTEADLPNINFVSSGFYVYIFCAGKKMLKLSVGSSLPGFSSDPLLFFIPPPPTYDSDTSSGAGYDLDYVVTAVVGGEETLASVPKTGLKLPNAAGQQNALTFDASPSTATEYRFYRRPTGGGAYGFIGSTNETDPVTGKGTFIDLGGDADYSHSPPKVNPTIAPIDFNPQTGFIYQNRLILTREDNTEAIEASRPGYQTDFNRDYPLQSDSALTFKAGTTGNANVLQFAEDSGLVVFTTVGIYINAGALSPDNIALAKKGNWVIEKTIPPLPIPGGLLFIDASTNTVRTLIFSTEAAAYLGEEISIYSNHLFTNRQATSWAFQDGDVPLVWMTFVDGSFTALTYQREQQMQAWTRHDSIGVNVEQVTVSQGFVDNGFELVIRNVAYFIVEKDGKRYIESTADRYVSDVKQYVGMDSSVSKTVDLGAAAGGANFTLTPTVTNDWAGTIVITADASTWNNVAGEGAPGTVYRVFDDDNSYADLVVTVYTNDGQITVQPSVEVPEGARVHPQIYETFTTVSGLDHMEGEDVVVHVDGNVIASPLNDGEQESYPTVTVSSGTITLPNSMRGSFIHVGRPVVSDIETLDIDTVEQKPTLIESEQVTKLYVKTYNSRGLFMGNEFPDGNDGTSVAGMEDMEYRYLSQQAADNDTIEGNAPVPLTTRRHELTLPGQWKSQGKICIRQVDCLPFEILSIIPDSINLTRIGN